MAQPNDEKGNIDFFVRGFAVGRRIQLWESITALARQGEITWDFSAARVGDLHVLSDDKSIRYPTSEDTSCRWAP